MTWRGRGEIESRPRRGQREAELLLDEADADDEARTGQSRPHLGEARLGQASRCEARRCEVDARRGDARPRRSEAEVKPS